MATARYQVSIDHVRGDTILKNYTYEVEADPDTYLNKWETKAAALLRKEEDFRPVQGDHLVYRSKKVRPLGSTQQHVLWSMVSFDRNGIWFPGCGWYWKNNSTTTRIMYSLKRRGLVTEDDLTGPVPKFTITDEGRKQAGDPGTLPAASRKE